MPNPIAAPLLAALFSTATMANTDAVTQCINDYTDRYTAMEADGEALPPMRNLYPEWEEDCNNGGELNEKLKAALSSEAAPMALSGNWAIDHVRNPLTGVVSQKLKLTSTTDGAVRVQDVIVNKGRCQTYVNPWGTPTRTGDGKWDTPTMTGTGNIKMVKSEHAIDYGQEITIYGTGANCTQILEVELITDGGTLTINP